MNRGRRYIILHGTGIAPGVPAENEIRFLRRKGAGVSYHYYVTKAGAVHSLVPTVSRAWHAGASSWGADSDLNDLSVGVALESMNGNDEEYPAAQWDACRHLVLLVMAEFGIAAGSVLTHKEVSVPQGRKVDPRNFAIDQFRSSLAGQVRIPLYGERNETLGTVTIVDGRKAYLPDEVRATLCVE